MKPKFRNKGTAKKKKIVKRLRWLDDDNCQLCGIKLDFNNPDTDYYRTIDHITPISKGGDETDIFNMRLVDLICHRKHNET